MSESGGTQPTAPGGVITASAVQNSSGQVANAIATATLAASVGKTTYLDGFEVTAAGATAALVVDVAVGGVSNALHYTFVFPAGATTAATPLIVELPQPIPASAPNTAITVTLPAGGAGNTNACVSAHGHYQ